MCVYKIKIVFNRAKVDIFELFYKNIGEIHYFYTMKELTLVIATYNRAEPLLLTLSSVVKQNLSPERWECIVVNNNSTDNTTEAAEEYIAQFPNLDIKVVFEKKQGLSHARNCGIEASQGEIIAIIDDDEVINEEFVEAYIDLFREHPKAVSAGGKIIPRYKESRPRWMSHYTELPIANPLDLGEQPKVFPKSRIPGGGNMAIRRSALEKYGLFDPDLGRNGERLIGGEESDLFERLASGGEECWYTPKAVMWHIIPPEKLTNDYFDRLNFNVGASQRIRAKINDRNPMSAEAIKWCVTIAIALWFVISLRPSKGLYLLRMRRQITKGLMKK